jgi:hypothetical protein
VQIGAGRLDLDGAVAGEDAQERVLDEIIGVLGVSRSSREPRG